MPSLYPGELFARSWTSDTISVTWGPAQGGFLRYKITISPPDAFQDEDFVYASEPDLVATFEGLNHATLYTIELTLEPSGASFLIQQVTSKSLINVLMTNPS